MQNDCHYIHFLTLHIILINSWFIFILYCFRCGHIFGKKCIEKWLKESQKCPQCNSKAKKSDLRLIYAKKLITLDTVELDHALQ